MAKLEYMYTYIQKNSAYRLTGLDSTLQIPHRRKLETGSLNVSAFYVSRKDPISKHPYYFATFFPNSMAKVSIGRYHSYLDYFSIALEKIKMSFLMEILTLFILEYRYQKSFLILLV